MNAVIGKFDPAVPRLVEHTGEEQGMHVAMDRLYVSANSSRGLANRHRALPRHGLQDFPALGREHFPQELDAGETNMIANLLALESRQDAPGHVLARGNGKSPRPQPRLHWSTSRQKSAIKSSGVEKR